MVYKVISGAQMGADISGLKAAKILGLETGGYVPNGVRTQDGNHSEYISLYGVMETISYSYVDRTNLNVLKSDGTLRIAVNFNTAGECLTLKCIKKHKKPSFDINPKCIYSKSYYKETVADFKSWINAYNIGILNVAGNSDSSVRKLFPDFDIEKWSIQFLVDSLKG